MNDDWIVIPKWDRFQHYKDREPLWIKLYTELNSSDVWLSCSCSARGLLVTCWLEYARSRGRVKRSHIGRIAGAGFKQSYLDSLNQAGFIEFSASAPAHLNTDKPLALARSREEEKEEEVTPPTPPPEGGTEKPSRAKGTNPRAAAKQAGDAEHHDLHTSLLAEASQVAAGWDNGGSEQFDEALDELEQRYHQQLGALERDTLWDVAFSR